MESQEQSPPKDILPRKLLLDSASIKDAINQAGARPPEEFIGEHSTNFLETGYPKDQKLYHFNVEINNTILFKEKCYYCTFESYVYGYLSITNQYLYFKPDESNNHFHKSEINSLNSLFIEFKHIQYVEWATNFLPDAIESRPNGWELKMFYNLFRINDDTSERKSPQSEGELPLSKYKGDSDNTGQASSYDTPNESLEDDHTQDVQYQNSFIFIFNTFDTLDNLSKWLSILLKDKAYNMPTTSNASSFAAEAYLHIKNSTSKFDPTVTRINNLLNKQATLPSIPYIPQLKLQKDSPVCMLDNTCLYQLSQHLPLQLNMCELSLAFSPSIHGVSFSTFYKNVTNQGPLIILVRDSSNVIFGTYTDRLEQHSLHYYGSDSTFVFTFKKMEDEFETDDPKIKVYRSTYLNNFYVYSDWNTIAIGGGGHYALTIENTFYRGSSSFSSTFNNSVLSSKPDFIIKEFQIWKFISPFT